MCKTFVKIAEGNSSLPISYTFLGFSRISFEKWRAAIGCFPEEFFENPGNVPTNTMKEG
jgi:hypothetical protein